MPMLYFQHERSRLGYAKTDGARSPRTNDPPRTGRPRLHAREGRPPGKILRPKSRWLEPRGSTETARTHIERSAHKHRHRRIPLRDRGLSWLTWQHCRNATLIETLRGDAADVRNSWLHRT